MTLEQWHVERAENLRSEKLAVNRLNEIIEAVKKNEAYKEMKRLVLLASKTNDFINDIETLQTYSQKEFALSVMKKLNSN